MPVSEIKSLLKQNARKLLLPLLYVFYYKPLKSKIRVTRDGKPLKPGISAVVAAKDEEYTISMCLESLVEVADQVICIDNGSTDQTLKLMYAFKEKYGSKIQVDILEMPGALLGDCREAGLKQTQHQWHLRWDADMVCKTSGPDDMRELRKKILKDEHPRAIQLPRTNLMGDLHHTYAKESLIVDPGEPILISFSKDIFYKEYGKFDAIRVPFYYRQVRESKRYYFHLSGLKSANNLLHRWFYFEWRSEVNKYKDKGHAVPPAVEDFAAFKEAVALDRLNAKEPLSVKYRFLRQFAEGLTKYDVARYGDYPKIVLDRIAAGDDRFEVNYSNGKPFMRTDKNDPEFIAYKPTNEDLSWDVDAYFARMQKLYS
jgi:glycosyltransferase involved in cell wall biosynthesis